MYEDWTVKFEYVSQLVSQLVTSCSEKRRKKKFTTLRRLMCSHLNC